MPLYMQQNGDTEKVEGAQCPWGCVLELSGTAGWSAEKHNHSGGNCTAVSACALWPRSAREAFAGCLRGCAQLCLSWHHSDGRVQATGSGFTATGMLQVQHGSCNVQCT